VRKPHSLKLKKSSGHIHTSPARAVPLLVLVVHTATVVVVVVVRVDVGGGGGVVVVHAAVCIHAARLIIGKHHTQEDTKGVSVQWL